jgi:hypothetical protein
MRHLAIALALPVIGCTSAPATIHDGCDEIATAFCHRYFQCPTITVSDNPPYANEGDCIAQTESTCSNETCPAGMGYDPSGVQACIDAYNNDTCDEFFSTGSSTPSCSQMCR